MAAPRFAAGLCAKGNGTGCLQQCRGGEAVPKRGEAEQAVPESISPTPYQKAESRVQTPRCSSDWAFRVHVPAGLRASPGGDEIGRGQGIL